jgi:hypothetical protein
VESLYSRWRTIGVDHTLAMLAYWSIADVYAGQIPHSLLVQLVKQYLLVFTFKFPKPTFLLTKIYIRPPNFCWYSIAGELNIYFQFFDGRLGYPFPSSSPCTGRLNSSCESSLRPSRRARCAWDRGASSDGDARNTGQYTCDGCRSV